MLLSAARAACSTVNERSLAPIEFFEDFFGDECQISFWSDVSEHDLWLL